jgi:dihydropteroate synthase
VDEGADILDVGGESSRPGADLLGAKEEAQRVVPLIAALAARVSLPISVDTCKPMVARMAIDAGASIVNLIRGTPADPAMLKIVGRFRAGLVLMHMRGTPRTMQKRAVYRDVVADVVRELGQTLDICPKYGINRECILVDPGIGFAKDADQNLRLLRRLKEMARLGYPLLVGTSRKSFIGKTLGLLVQDRIFPTIATAVLAVMGGAHIVRVHDVKAVRQAVLMTDAVINSK